MSIYEDDTTVYRCSFQNLEGQNLAVHRSSDLALVTQCGNDLLVKFKTAKTKVVTFHYHLVDHEMDGCSLKEVPCLERLLGLKLSSDLN